MVVSRLTFKPNHQWQLKIDFLACTNDSIGNGITLHNPTKYVHQYHLDLKGDTIIVRREISELWSKTLKHSSLRYLYIPCLSLNDSSWYPGNEVSYSIPYLNTATPPVDLQ